MIVIVGESACGKSSVAKYLTEHYGYKRIVTYTTRKPRDGEQDGVDYFYINQQHFKTLEDQNFFAETATYNGWSYTEYGFKRTGCACCPYGRDFDDELKVLEQHEPNLCKAVKNIFHDSYEYTRQYRKFRKEMEESGENEPETLPRLSSLRFQRDV